MHDWYQWICNAEHKETCLPNWLPDTQFLCIRPSERQKGYATIQLCLAKNICRSMGMDRILVRCHKENAASQKAIINNGGFLENEVTDPRNGEILQRYWIHLDI